MAFLCGSSKPSSKSRIHPEPPCAPTTPSGDRLQLGPSFLHFTESYGKNCFSGAVAKKYLLEAGLSDGMELKVFQETALLEQHKDTVAKAVMKWAIDNGASIYTHWFQPLSSELVRSGLTGQVHNAMFRPGPNGVEWVFKGETMIQGETDGSSYNNGGLRRTHTAAAYTVIDPSSPMFIRDDTVYIPTVFVAFTGEALDEKTPLLRSMQAVSREAVKLLGSLGHKATSVVPNIGLEQEFFLVPREAYFKRPDLQLCGRTVMGKSAPRGQEMCDHYMSQPNEKALACMREIQHECFKLGIPLQTRHREVAPNQYECAPFFGLATGQIDNNLLVMTISEEVAARHGMAALFAEKPFKGINGSGKHNNWSLGTDTGLNLLNAKQVSEKCTDADAFAVIMAAMIQALDTYGDLMRAATAVPGNDFRLGACEAPPAIVSTYLGKALTDFLDSFKKGEKVEPYKAASVERTFCGSVPSAQIPSEDRNRTSPFPYGGHRFEFRAVGSSQNVSMTNTILCSITAHAFAEFNAKIEKGEKPADVARAALEKHWRIIFNGNGYGEDWPKEAESRGLWNLPSCVDAVARLADPKNVALFESLKDATGKPVMTKSEMESRVIVLHEQYVNVVEMEALTMIDMIQQHVLPSALLTEKAGIEMPAKAPISALKSSVADIKSKLEAMHKAAPAPATDKEGAAKESVEMQVAKAKAMLARELRLETMERARDVCDAIEAIVPANLWTLSTYNDLLFLDATTGSTSLA
ncbi:hypothetical protein AB1Y20_008876 [Prymnesium parvum]|uniref:GS catalytic domain-containing protein n=1 Tax=Prymnesium parvum TaxID=97485 RepID=A0AB34ISR6_PRYPA